VSNTILKLAHTSMSVAAHRWLMARREVLLRIRFERLLTARRTEKVAIALVFGCVFRGGLVDVHTAHRIFCHQATDSTG